MHAAAVVVIDPQFQNRTQVCLGQRNQSVQTFPSNRADDALADRIAYRAARWSFQDSDLEPANRLIEMFGKDAVAIVNQEFVPVFVPDRLTQLLQRPSGTRMRCDVAMDQTTAAMLEHYEHIQQAKRCGDSDEEVAGNDSLGVQAQKG